MKAAFCTNFHLQPTFLRGATDPTSSALPGMWTVMLGSEPVDTNAFSQGVDTNARSSRLLTVTFGSEPQGVDSNVASMNLGIPYVDSNARLRT